MEAHPDQHNITKKNNALMIRMDRKREGNRLKSEKLKKMAGKTHLRKTIEQSAGRKLSNKEYRHVRGAGQLDK